MEMMVSVLHGDVATLQVTEVVDGMCLRPVYPPSEYVQPIPEL